MQNKKRNNNKNHYSINIIENDGVACISIDGSGLHYSTQGLKEPKIDTTVSYKEKKRKRGIILKRLGKWETGQNLKLMRKSG